MSTTRLSRENRAERNIARNAIWTIGLLTLASYVVNVTTIQMEAARAGRDIETFQPWFIEGASVLVILALIPLLLVLERRYPLVTGDWKRSLPFHLAGILVYSILHVGLMGLIREGLHPLLFGRPYDFFANPVEVFLYELRKDAMTYVLQTLTISAYRMIEWARMDAEAAREEARQSHRLTLKCGGRTMLVEAASFESAKAAGNYVEIRVTQGEHLARMTLAELEQQLGNAGIDAVRVHRSWLVNRDQITQIAPTGEGDVRISLKSGETVPGSRRYRDRLEAA